MKQVFIMVILVCFVSFAGAQTLNLPKVDTKDVKSKTDQTVNKANANTDVSMNELSKQLKNVQNEKGPIVFKTGKATLDVTKCEVTLKTTADIIKAFPGFLVRIDGHTDNVGSAKANKILSQKRAEAVRGHLISKYKIPAKRLAAKGFGDSQPIADNKTKEGQEKNRRVDFTVSRMK